MGMMFLLMFTGLLLRKSGWIDQAGKRCLTNIILYVILPCNIVKAYSMELKSGFFKTFAALLIVAVLNQILAMIITRVMYNRLDEKKKKIYQYATVCSNAGFMGNALAQGVFGDTGLLYASVFLIPQRVVMWTAGVSFFTTNVDKKEAYKKILVHPCMIATYIGFAIMIFHIRLPGVIYNTLNSISSCCTAMTMMYVGTILIDVDFKTLLDKMQIRFAILRLVLIPLAIFAGCVLAKVDPLVTGVSVLLAGMPAGSTTSLLAAKYGADEATAAKCVVFTTALSMISIPVWVAVLLNYIG